jgi:hypothetical protein
VCPMGQSSYLTHRRCAKLSTAHGREVDGSDPRDAGALVMIALDKIKKLESRVKELELTVREHHRNIPFRVGGE